MRLPGKLFEIKILFAFALASLLAAPCCNAIWAVEALRRMTTFTYTTLPRKLFTTTPMPIFTLT